VQIRSVEFAFIGVSQVILGAFRGAGNTKTAMMISILTLWVGRVASVAYLVFVAGWGETGIWVGMALGNILGATVAVAWSRAEHGRNGISTIRRRAWIPRSTTESGLEPGG